MLYLSGSEDLDGSVDGGCRTSDWRSVGLSSPPSHFVRSTSFERVETCGCLSKQPYLSLRSRGSVSKHGKVPSKPTPNTNRPVCPINSDLRVRPSRSSIVFRDQLYKHLETVPANDFEGVTNKLVQAGGTLEYLKYADALFEILLIGGLLQPGGNYLDDGAPPSPFSILKAKEPVEVADVKLYIDVLNKLIRR